ncbi:MAG: chorismate mutase [Lentisphaeria bacterium]|nr:chorismate mutase [Lentisphaeria bacterium]
MDESMLANARKEIDRINAGLTGLLVERMRQVDIVAAWKRENNLPVSVPAREEAIIAKVCAQCGKEFAPEIEKIFRAIFKISCEREERLIASGGKK